ncbi:DMT family transporter [Gemmobacter sp.]|uniref:DMT family transporter n=1 Tax=Gemmobacter sp. TaxID=1898957 RepID=UPI002AFF61C8|nr:DMT family transporter [Gemmobacter sp.]
MQPLRGIGFKIASVLIFICMQSLIKSTSDHVPPGEAVFFRSFFAIPVIVVWLYLRRELHEGVGTANPMGHLWRAFVGTLAMGLGFASLGFLPLPEVTALGYAAPLLVVIFAAMFLGEKVGAWRLGAVGLGLVGVLIVLSPRLSIGAGASHAQALGATLALGGAVFTALAQILIRKLVQTERTATIVFWFSFNAAALSLVTLPFGWVVPTLAEAALLICAGILGGVAQIFLTSSYRHADASVVAPFEYASMLFALGIGYMVFDEIPTLTMLAGAGLVVVAGILIIWRERKLGLERAQPRKAMTPNG